jgi:NAD(P)-dependent dehydrogenase (short-subunit alcohol dehydrogenase family)
MDQMIESNNIALVTGANKGIGLEIARQLLKRGIFVYLGSRDPSKGELAAKKLHSNGNLLYPVKLDVTNQRDILNVTNNIRSKFGKLDILLNNAGALIGERDLPSQTKMETVRRTFETNLFGAWNLCNAAIPLMRKNKYGRIVNVSSGVGSLNSIAKSLYAPAYSLSKASLNALTMILARELSGSNILVNSMSPGWVRTDMGGRNAPRSVEEGADTAVWLATLPDDGPTGGFFEDRKRIEW